HRASPSLCYTLSLHDALPICFVQIRLLPGRRVVAEEAADEINLLVRVPHLDCNGGTQSVAVWAALAPFRLAKGNPVWREGIGQGDRKSTRLNSSHVSISYAVF